MFVTQSRSAVYTPVDEVISKRVITFLLLPFSIFKSLKLKLNNFGHHIESLFTLPDEKLTTRKANY